jgi:hypothetical protein
MTMRTFDDPCAPNETALGGFSGAVASFRLRGFLEGVSQFTGHRCWARCADCIAIIVQGWEDDSMRRIPFIPNPAKFGKCC